MRYAEAAGIDGATAESLRPRLVATEEDIASAREHEDAWSRSASGVVGIAPGGSRKWKRWPAQRYDGLARRLESRGIATLRFDPPGEGGGPGGVATDLRGLKAFLTRCRAVVTNDSGVMHMAVGSDVPVVALFGSTVLEFGFGPLGFQDEIVERDMPCRPCAPHGARYCWLAHGGCLIDITEEDVLGALDVLLEGGRRP